MRMNFLIFAFGFDFVVQLVSRCLFFALTFRVVPLLTSTYVACLCRCDTLPYQPLLLLAPFSQPARKNVMVSFLCSCRFSLPRFRNLAANRPCFVSSRRFSIPLLYIPLNCCGLVLVGLSLDFCATHIIGANVGRCICLQMRWSMSILALVLLFALTTYVIDRCLFRRHIWNLTAMACMS